MLRGAPRRTAHASSRNNPTTIARLASIVLTEGSRIASLRGEPTTPYKHKHVGSVASLGLYQGVAQVYGVKLRGFPAWFMHRTYHVSRVPTFNRKARVIADWTLALLFRREVVSLWSIHDPAAEFEKAARDKS